MGYLPDATVAAFKGTYNCGLFFRLDTSPALHLWWGISDIPARVVALDSAGTVYIGAGYLTNVPDALEVLINGTAERVDWSMSGVPASLTANLADAAPSVVGKACMFGVAALDERWQMQSDIVPLWSGTADFWSEAQPPQSDVTKEKLRTLTLTTMTGDSSRALPFYSTWTDRIQQFLSPGDLFCDRTPRYFQGQIIRWPRF